MSYFAQVIAIVAVALLFTKYGSAMKYSDFDDDNYCGSGGGGSLAVKSDCGGPGQCQYAWVDFDDQSSLQWEYIGLCWAEDGTVSKCVTRTKNWTWNGSACT